MAEPHMAPEDVQEMEVESHAPYIRVWLALAVFTAIEYVYAHLFKDAFTALVVGLMTWAIIKAALVGWYFMHLKFEGRWVYYMLIPAAFLVGVLVFALMPDIGTLHEPLEPESEASISISAPLNPAPALA